MLQQTHAVFLDHATLDLGDLDLQPLRERFSRLTLHDHTQPSERVERLRGAQIAITNKVCLDAETLAACPDLRLILIAATGTNNVDLIAARQHHVTVCNCQGYGTPAVAQHTLMLMLALANSLQEYQQQVRTGQWQRSAQFCLLDHPIMELSGKTLGVLGFGELGRAVATLAQAFGMRVLLGELPGRPAPDHLPLSRLLPEVDILSLHCPLNEQTHHLIGAQQLAQMKPTALLINTARGGLVDEHALADALRNGRLGGAATDVLSEEPPRHGNPLLAADIPRLIITPHTAWGSREARQRIVTQLSENAAAFFEAAPIRIVS